MDEDAYLNLTAEAIASAVRARELSAVEVVEAALARVELTEAVLCAFLEVWSEEALERARAIDRRIAAGERPRLAGVPIGVKGRWGGQRAAARALVAEGCVPIGATSVPGPGTVWQTWGLGRGGRTVNPWRPDRTPGGSSAGSAAAVAAGMVPLATGSDGAGSVRIPAAWCGVFGLKVTHGAVPSADRGGLAAPGVLTRRAGDAAAYLRCVLGPREESAVRRVPHAVWSSDLGFAGTDPEVEAVARAAAGRLAEEGIVRLLDGEPVVLADPGPAWLALRTSGADRDRAEAVRAVNNRRMTAAFDRADVLLTPVTPSRPHGHEGPGERYSTALTWGFNLSGHPAASIPAGRTADGCPVGLHLVAPHGAESLLIGIAQAAETRAALLPQVALLLEADGEGRGSYGGRAVSTP